jgi:Glycosyl hydrolase family 63 C-terminal domain
VRLQEADDFYRSVTPPSISRDAAKVMRQGLAGMLWSKQFFFFDGDNWLDEHRSNPLHTGYRNSRNSEWYHMLNQDIISMPDKWKYPWYAAWDLAFHALPLSIVDPDFAKEQLELMLCSNYLHPNGQMPAYEWNFSDVNLFSQNMLDVAFEITAHDPAYEPMIMKFAEHFCYIGSAMNRPGQDGMWDEEDGFYYDLLRLPDGTSQRLKVRSMVGLLPLCATTIMEKSMRERIPRTMAGLHERLRRIPELQATIHPTGPGNLGVGERGILALLNPERLRRILTKMLDEDEFLSPYGVRSLSKFHEQHPFVLNFGGQEHRVDYLPAESNSGMFGGNSNWRGPIWMPVNTLIIRALLNFYLYYGDNLKIECPTGSGKLMNLFEVSKEIADRLSRIFTRDEHGRRPVYGSTEKFQSDAHWRDHILFYEYFHGDIGAGLGAKIIELYGFLDPKRALQVGRQAAFTQERRAAG